MTNRIRSILPLAPATAFAFAARTIVCSTVALVCAADAIVRAPDAQAADPTPPTAPFTPEIDEAQWETRVAHLAGEAFSGRESGTPGGDATEEWVASELARLGYEPWGDAIPDPKQSARSPFQKVPMPWRPLLAERSWTELRLADGTVRRLEPKDGAVPFSFSKGGRVEGAIVFAGYGLKAEGWDDWAGLDARGKIAVVLRHGPNEDKPDSPWHLRGKNLKLMSFVEKAKNAHAAGAAAMLVVNDRHHETDMLPVNAGDEESPIPVVAMKRRDVNGLLAPLGKELVELEKEMERGGKPLPASVPGASAVIDASFGNAHGRNVVFMRRGSDPALAAECVVVGAHLDHVGLGWFGSTAGPAAGGQTHNGADDNASGTATLLEAAEAMAAGPAPKRTVIFAAWCGEEKGLVGSAFWCKNPTWELSRVVANVNLDMVGRYRDGADDPAFQVVGGATGAGLEAMCHRIAKAEGLRPVTTWEAWEQSDHFSFYRHKIPALFLHTGLHPDYHKPADDWWRLNAKGGARIARAVTRITQEIADLPERPAFAPKPPIPILGVRMGDSEDGKGAVLSMIFPDLPAAKAGLKAKDRVVAFAGAKIEDSGDLQGVLLKQTPGTEVDITYVRGTDEPKTVKITVGSR